MATHSKTTGPNKVRQKVGFLLLDALHCCFHDLLHRSAGNQFANHQLVYLKEDAIVFFLFLGVVLLLDKDVQSRPVAGKLALLGLIKNVLATLEQ